MTPVEGADMPHRKVEFQERINMPKVPQLETCCCCCSTETGSKVIGWLMTIGSLITTVATGFAFFTAIKYHGEVIPGSKDGTVPDQKVETMDVVEIAFAFAISVFTLLLGIYLLMGIYKRNMSYVRLWVVWSTVYLIFIGVVIVLGIIKAITSGHQTTLLSEIINFCLSAYYVLVVYSYYREQRQSAPGNY